QGNARKSLAELRDQRCRCIDSVKSKSFLKQHLRNRNPTPASDIEDRGTGPQPRAPSPHNGRPNGGTPSAAKSLPNVLVANRPGGHLSLRYVTMRPQPNGVAVAAGRAHPQVRTDSRKGMRGAVTPLSW